MISGPTVNSDIQGYFTFNSEKYSISDLVGALLSQGISIHKVGTNLKIGQKIINPIINNPLNYSSKFEEPINENVIQGLANQIQRIFSELNKLKDHLGINNDIMQEFSSTEKQLFEFSSANDKNSRHEQFEMKKKWEDFIPSKNFDLSPEKKINLPQETPIITLGKKKNSSLIEEYTDLVTNKGVPDNDALDSLSSRIFNSANRSIGNFDDKSDLRTAIVNQQSDKLGSVTNNDFSTYSFVKCNNCNSKIPNESQFCSKCGMKI